MLAQESLVKFVFLALSNLRSKVYILTLIAGLQRTIDTLPKIEMILLIL